MIRRSMASMEFVFGVHADQGVCPSCGQLGIRVSVVEDAIQIIDIKEASSVGRYNLRLLELSGTMIHHGLRVNDVIRCVNGAISYTGMMRELREGEGMLLITIMRPRPKSRSPWASPEPALGWHHGNGATGKLCLP